MLFTWLSYVTCLLNIAHGSSHVVEFINDLMESSEVNQCDFGYIYEHGRPKFENTVINTMSQRYQTLFKTTSFFNLNALISEHT